ncbi:hypothetical protein ARMGADRAFT_1029957 [Armillaria gallica]|uniref:Uncharacterized protein n=1 Tax=Armillaria gallica TaxID=47427 RepID=A0A2H3DFZ7_ARMGA|nr:hypothetical protein ARMGADRAFT_1029957 [Armillaria gallica]
MTGVMSRDFPSSEEIQAFTWNGVISAFPGTHCGYRIHLQTMTHWQNAGNTGSTNNEHHWHPRLRVKVMPYTFHVAVPKVAFQAPNTCHQHGVIQEFKCCKPPISHQHQTHILIHKSIERNAQYFLLKHYRHDNVKTSDSPLVAVAVEALV